MKNIHITLTDFRNESRLLKEVTSLDNAQLFNGFMVIALGSEDLEKDDQLMSSLKVRRLNLWSRSLPKNATFQLIKYFEFILRCFFILYKEKADVISIHTLALLPLGVLSKWLLRFKLVYDAHELETEKNGLSGVRQKISKFVERLFIRRCDLVIVVGDNIADWYTKEYNIERPLVVKNAPFRKTRVHNNLFREQLCIAEEQKILLYQGGLMRGRGVHLILEAFKKRMDHAIVVVFMGYGDLESQVLDAQKHNRNIFFFPAVSPSVVLDYTASADVGISYIENTCLSYFYCMPNKLFEYAMAGLPVLISNMKEMEDAVTENDFGMVVNEPTSDAINKAIDELLMKNLDEMSCAAYQFASDHAWEVQQDVMLEGYRRMLE